jgi:hypothetical protein
MFDFPAGNRASASPSFLLKPPLPALGRQTSGRKPRGGPKDPPDGVSRLRGDHQSPTGPTSPGEIITAFWIISASRELVRAAYCLTNSSDQVRPDARDRQNAAAGRQESRAGARPLRPSEAAPTGIVAINFGRKTEGRPEGPPGGVGRLRGDHQPPSGRQTGVAIISLSAGFHTRQAR